MNYTENLSLGLPEYGEDADVADLNRNSGILDAYCYNTRQIECKPYDSTKTYMSGDLAIHNEVVYECNTDNTTGAWDDSKWDSTTLAEQIAKAKQMGGESALADLEDVEITNPSTGQALLFDDDDDKWKNQDLPDVSVTKTATGNPIEFTDGADAPLVKCTTAIQGYQDLHGYDKPWVGGAGKNKLPLVLSYIKSANTSGTWSGNVYTLNGVTFTINTDNDGNVTGIKAQGLASANANLFLTATNGATIKAGTYTWSCAGTVSGSVVWIIGGSSNTAGVEYHIVGGGSGYSPTSTQTVSDGTTGYNFIQVSNGYNANTTLYPQCESGTNTTSFAPYSNICPITAYNQSTISVEDENEVVQQTSTATFSQPIYQGNADFVGSGAECEKPLFTNDGTGWNVASNGAFYLDGQITGAVIGSLGSDANIICNLYPSGYVGGSTDISILNPKTLCIQNVNGYMRLIVYDNTFSRETLLDSLMAFTNFLAQTNIQIVYELATPTTETITPTNLPIKSLFGYNHIESSTGDMEVEYITENYQPLVDLIQSSNGHTYSTQEQVVGKWVDGKDLYERTFVVTNVQIGATVLVADASQMKLVSAVGTITDDAQRTFPTQNKSVHVYIYQNIMQLENNATVLSEASITVRYTKSTTRSLSAPVTSQKAQIEPLTDKTEEVPTEEEVNEEENTNER